MSKCLTSKFKFENLKTGADLCLVSTLNKKTKKNKKRLFSSIFIYFSFLARSVQQPFLCEAYYNKEAQRRNLCASNSMS